jgi:predicted transcriptional regulator
MADITNLSQAVFDLKRDVRQILLRVNGVRSFREIAQGLNLEEGAATRLADALLAAGVLERVAVGVFKLNAELWQMLRRFNGVRSLREIAQDLNLEEGTAARSVNVLKAADLLDGADGASPPSSASTTSTSSSVQLNGLTAELAKVLGPVAALIVDDEISALGEARETFPRRRIEELIDRVSQAIQDQAKRARFQQVARDAIAKH